MATDTDQTDTDVADTAHDAFAALPDEVLALVLARLDAAGLRRASVVSRRWRRVVADEGSWRRAVAHNLGRLPYERLSTSWQRELDQRQHQRRLWRRGHRRLGVSARTGTVDAVVAPYDAPWVLAFGCVGVVCTRLDSDGRLVGKVGPLDGRGTALAACVDQGVWGLQDGRCVCVRLTPAGSLSRVVWQKDAGRVPVACVAGSRDTLRQRSAKPGATPGDVASADVLGVVRVWCAEDGAQRCVLRAPGEPLLLRVAWADSGRYVAAASARALFVWRLADGHLRHVPLPHTHAAPVLLLAGDPHAPVFFVATELGAWRLADEDFEAFRTPDAPLTSAALDLYHAADAATRLLCLGDARGGVTLLNADAPAAAPLHAWRAVHNTAVAAVGASATAVASAGRDGSVAVHDVLAGDRLCSAWARAGGRSAAHAPWARAVMADLHGVMHVRHAVVAAQLLARRTQAQWAMQKGPLGDSLDRAALNPPPERWIDEDEPEEQAEVPFDSAAQAAAGAPGDGIAGFFAWSHASPVLNTRFPSLVAHLAVTPSSLCVANATHVLLCSPAPPPLPAKKKDKKSAHVRQPQSVHEVREDVEAVRREEAGMRRERLERAEVRERVEREFVQPLGLAEDEQLQYAVWLSSHASAVTDTMTEDEQLAYALLLSQDEQ
ncbi:hypothetical protein GGI05_001471 [Coemansia sp. RSA 2603]|nr:hypothetical protein GGI05_001471 [Coemansia sp. RSA 2603]